MERACAKHGRKFGSRHRVFDFCKHLVRLVAPHSFRNGFRLVQLMNQVKRAAANLIVNSSDVLAQQSYADELDASQVQNSEKRPDMSRSWYYPEILEME